jgi:hypothetical protein
MVSEGTSPSLALAVARRMMREGMVKPRGRWRDVVNKESWEVAFELRRW